MQALKSPPHRVESQPLTLAQFSTDMSLSGLVASAINLKDPESQRDRRLRDRRLDMPTEAILITFIGVGSATHSVWHHSWLGWQIVLMKKDV